MKLVICSVRDAKSESFGSPFFLPSVGSAIRSFDDEVNRKDENNIMNTHAEDFTLYQLGTFDNNTGEFETFIPKVLVMGDQVKKIKES